MPAAPPRSSMRQRQGRSKEMGQVTGDFAKTPRLTSTMCLFLRSASRHLLLPSCFSVLFFDFSPRLPPSATNLKPTTLGNQAQAQQTHAI